MAVNTNHKVFSSEAKLGGIAIQDMHSVEGALELEMFIAMDPPKHDQQRKAVTPAVAPSNLLLLERSEEHTSELQSLMRISYAVFCLKKKKQNKKTYKTDR